MFFATFISSDKKNTKKKRKYQILGRSLGPFRSSYNLLLIRAGVITDYWITSHAGKELDRAIYY